MWWADVLRQRRFQTGRDTESAHPRCVVRDRQVLVIVPVPSTTCSCLDSVPAVLPVHRSLRTQVQ